jgi:hypothetical protein
MLQYTIMSIKTYVVEPYKHHMMGELQNTEIAKELDSVFEEMTKRGGKLVTQIVFNNDNPQASHRSQSRQAAFFVIQFPDDQA